MNYNTMQVIDFTSYKDFLREYVDQRRRPGLMTELANAAGCNRTYLSQVLSLKTQLTMDHAYLLCDHFGFSEMEAEYFLTLVLKERSSRREVQDKHEAKLARLREKFLNLSKRIDQKKDSKELTDRQKTIYYSSWKYAVVHIMTSCSEFQTASTIAQRLSLPIADVEQVLESLRKMKLVEWSGEGWMHSSENVHVHTGNLHHSVNQFNWRMKAVESIPRGDGIHYSICFSLSKKQENQLKKQLLQFIESQREIIHQSGTEEVYVFCCDLFRP